MMNLRARGAPPRERWSEPLHEYDAARPGAPPRLDERPPRRSGDAGAHLGRRPPQRPPPWDEGRVQRPPRRPSDAGFGMHGPPRGPLGSGPEWPEDEDEWVERPARRPRRPAVAVAEPEPGTRSPRQKQPKRKKRPLSPAEKRLRRFRYAALLGVMAFASLGGAAFSFNLVALAVLSMVLCLPCAVLYLYF